MSGGSGFWYAVVAELPTPQVRDEFLDWLAHDHLQQVVEAGASAGEAIVIDSPEGGPFLVECRYLFESREAFAAYEAGPAEALRADGRARFGPDRGVTMRRRTGTRRLSRAGSAGC